MGPSRGRRGFTLLEVTLALSVGVLLLGALTGAMTATPALALVTREAKSSLPALGYTGTYAIASILLTVAGTLIMHL